MCWGSITRAQQVTQAGRFSVLMDRECVTTYSGCCVALSISPNLSLASISSVFLQWLRFHVVQTFFPRAMNRTLPVSCQVDAWPIARLPETQKFVPDFPDLHRRAGWVASSLMARWTHRWDARVVTGTRRNPLVMSIPAPLTHHLCFEYLRDVDDLALYRPSGCSPLCRTPKEGDCEKEGKAPQRNIADSPPLEDRSHVTALQLRRPSTPQAASSPRSAPGCRGRRPSSPR